MPPPSYQDYMQQQAQHQRPPPPPSAASTQSSLHIAEEFGECAVCFEALCGQGLTLVPISVQLELTLPLSA